MAGDGFSPGWYEIEVLNQTGYPMTVEFRIRRETVEVWFQDRCQAILDRDLFRIWLDRNPAPYVVDDVMWTMANAETVGLIIRDSGCLLIPVELMAGLHERVCGPV